MTGGATDTLSWTDAPSQRETTMMNIPEGSQASRRVFLGPVLTHDLTLSGTPSVELTGSLSTALTLRASDLRRAGRYAVTIAARDAAGNRAKAITATVTLKAAR